jgi:Cys-tRNA(Pro) deacylase
VKEPEVPVTPAVRVLRAAGVSFTPHLYDYLDRGGTRHAAESLHIEEHAVVKTLVMEAEGDAGRRRPLLVLMHGDLEVSTKQLARFLNVKTVSSASPTAVETYTGYLPGGVSPFGTRSSLSVYVEQTLLGLQSVYINGGKRGFLVAIHPSDLQRVLAAVPVAVGIRGSRA